MRCGLGVIVVAAACGRIDFDARSDGGTGDAFADAPITTGASRIVAYGDHTCAIVRGGAYCWGDNSSVIVPNTPQTSTPSHVPTTGGAVTAIGVGESHACMLVDGDLQCFGNTAPLTVQGGGAPFVAVAAGHDFTCAVSDRMYCWGDNGAGQLGVGDIGVHAVPTANLVTGIPSAISLGDDHACALVGDKAQCWGHNDNGTLGTGSFVPDHQTMPVDVVAPSALPHIAGWHACALAPSGQVMCWGRGDHGELGTNTMVDNADPAAVMLDGVTAIATGGGPSDFDASCAIAPPKVYCWGAGQFGRLGTGVANQARVPQLVVGIPDGAIEVVLGYDHTCARYANGDVWCWGRGDLGQLGDGKNTSNVVPVQVTLP